jgi:hypothetical protein
MLFEVLSYLTPRYIATYVCVSRRFKNSLTKQLPELNTYIQDFYNTLEQFDDLTEALAYVKRRAAHVHVTVGTHCFIDIENLASGMSTTVEIDEVPEECGWVFLDSGNLLLIGGIHRPTTKLRQVLEVIPEYCSYFQTSPLVDTRYGLASCLFQGDVFAFGGDTKTCEKRERTGRWRLTAPLTKLERGLICA